jgi:RNA dependent RNA polymerase
LLVATRPCFSWVVAQTRFHYTPILANILLIKVCDNRSRMLATCLVYRFTVENGSDIFEEIKHKSMGAAPMLQSTPVGGISASVTLDDQISQFDHELALCQFPYGLRFQLQRLWTNTYLSPNEVGGLLHSIAQVRSRLGDDVVVQVVRRFSNQILYTGPEVDPASLELPRLLELIEIAEKSVRGDRLSNLVSVRSGRGAILIHKATVTPTGVYLEGPDEEGSNRVLRRYSTYADHFLRISFVEENGERITFDRESSNEKIFHEGFQPILRSGVNIGEL